MAAAGTVAAKGLTSAVKEVSVIDVSGSIVDANGDAGLRPVQKRVAAARNISLR
jgi:hypothetical protein